MSADIEMLLERALADVHSDPQLGERVADAADQRRRRRRLSATFGGFTLVAASAAAVIWVSVAVGTDTGTARISPTNLGPATLVQPTPKGAGNERPKPSAANSTPASVPAITARKDLAHQIQVRKQFGLDASPAFVAGLQGKPGLDSNYIGVPITPAEAAEMEARNRAGLKLASIDAVLSAQQPGTFGGTWIDQAAGGVVVIASTDPASVNTDEVKALLPLGTKTEVRKVAVSLAYLRQLSLRIGSDPILRGDGTGYGIFEMDNRVEVDLPTSTPRSTVNLLYAKYGTRGFYIRILDSSLLNGGPVTR